ncbi:Protein CBG10492 [Caenorhabditis briggsae]|uniref:Protein CBG10492 n=1 Tax=Caenorhabditis briggsae TaxID=6238 RepID=A8XAX6_CAEBR|nr:Protein CBG10492 [Caenorhabditis briggsae]CAP29904.2 Protein CBG10492 [Caenorhabditis briggsae]
MFFKKKIKFSEPNCWFLEEIVSYETISKWPRNCTEICGKMIFNQYSDIPVFELQSYFANVSVFRGSISFEKSKYASIEFLSGLKSIECEPYTFGFYNNPNLEQLNFGPSTNFTCPFSIFDNKRLDASAFCGINEGLFEVISDGNLKNCPGCIGTEMYKKTAEDFRNCTLVTTSLDLLSYQFIANGFDLTAFGDIENISAEFSVVRTDFESLSFLKNLKTIKGSAYDTVSYDIDIRDNQNLTRLGISLIRNLIPRKPVFLANFEANHADFCFTIDEFKVFLENKVVFGNLNAKLCENKTTACIFKNLKDLKSNCSEIQGNISINSGDEVYIGKLKSVRFIWGSLTVQDTNITDLAFLESLEYAVNLNSTGSWVHGFMGSWVHGFIGSWIPGFMNSWVHGFMSSWVHEFMGSWVHGFMGSWVHGFMGSWVHGLYNTDSSDLEQNAGKC